MYVYACMQMCIIIMCVYVYVRVHVCVHACVYVWIFKLLAINEPSHCLFITGGTNKEFNFRHDWNSLVSDDESLLMKHYTKDYFPHADIYVSYRSRYMHIVILPQTV